MDDYPVQCANCGSHFNVDPAGDIQGTACPECGGTRMFQDQPSPTQSDGTLRNMVDSDTQIDQGGNPLGEGTIMGIDGERPMGKRDNYMHSKILDKMEPYPGLFSDESFLKSATHREAFGLGDIWNGVKDVATNPYVDMGAGAAMMAVPGLDLGPAEALGGAGVADAAGAGLAGAAEGAGADAAEGAAEDAAGGGIKQMLGQGAKKMIGQGAGQIMKGVMRGGVENMMNGGGAAPAAAAPAQAQNLLQFGSVQDIPMMLTAELEDGVSVKSVDEQHDDPEDQDQKEFNDGDNDTKNLKNPNLDDSGADGEDDARSDSSAQTGFAEDSPGIERMQMVLPLLMNYLVRGESGADDPIVKGLHEALEGERPGYLDEESEHGPKIVELLIQNHKKAPKASRTADVNGYMPGGLPATPSPSSGVAATPQPGTDMPAQQTGGGTCPVCGAPLAADGSCPQCGFKAHPQGGSQVQTPSVGTGGVSAPGLSQPFTGKVANGVGPQTPEQKSAVEQLLINEGRQDEIPYIEIEPQRFWKELAQIQGDSSSTAPLVDPSQQNQTPPQPMPGAPGAMPMPDPSQAGAGGQPMMPMSHTADANNNVRRCPKCNSASTSIEGVGDNSDGSDTFGRCHSCGHTFDYGEDFASDRKSNLVALANPALDAAEQTAVRPEEGQDSSQTWLDTDGAPIEIGMTYDLHSPQYPIPDEVQVVTKKPDELGVKLVGEVSNGLTGPSGVDFKIRPQDLQDKGYSFTPAADAQTSPEQADQPIGGTPGMPQYPAAEPTTDQQASTYPNGGATISSVLTGAEDDNETCHKCGHNIVTHTASSATTIGHECHRCLAYWETQDEDEQHTASADLSWINEDSSPIDFTPRAGEMERAASGSRNLADIAAKDTRLQAIHERLEGNRHEAGRHFSPSEQRSLINEQGTARNSDLLDLSNTHYESSTMFDPRDPKGRANADNAPDEHLFLGI